MISHYEGRPRLLRRNERKFSFKEEYKYDPTCSLCKVFLCLKYFEPNFFCSTHVSKLYVSGNKIKLIIRSKILHFINLETRKKIGY